MHSQEYKAKFADNLSKELPKIPLVKKIADFRIYSQAGRTLAGLHLNYDEAPLYPITIESTRPLTLLTEADYRVEQMKFLDKSDKSKVIYNNLITISEIPLEAYEYIISSKSALEWVMDRQSISYAKDSGIKDDVNDWAIETMHDPAYPLKLFQRVITVSLETMKIVNNLPKLDI